MSPALPYRRGAELSGPGRVSLSCSSTLQQSRCLLSRWIGLVQLITMLRHCPSSVATQVSISSLTTALEVINLIWIWSHMHFFEVTIYLEMCRLSWCFMKNFVIAKNGISDIRGVSWSSSLCIQMITAGRDFPLISFLYVLFFTFDCILIISSVYWWQWHISVVYWLCNCVHRLQSFFNERYHTKAFFSLF